MQLFRPGVVRNEKIKMKLFVNLLSYNPETFMKKMYELLHDKEYEEFDSE